MATRYTSTYPQQSTLNKANNFDKLNRLSDKLNVINVNYKINLKNSIDVDKSSKFEFLHQKVSEIDEKLNETNEQTMKKFSIVKDNLDKIQKQIDSDRNKSEALVEEKNKYIKSFESRINDRFNHESEIRKEIERRFVNLVEDKFNALKIEISKESRSRYESIENLKSFLENDVPKLQGLVKYEQGEREINDDECLKKVREDVTFMNSTLMEEKKVREDTEEAILEMLRIMITKMKSEIENEKKDREVTEETLLALLEDTCNKLNTASQI